MNESEILRNYINLFDDVNSINEDELEDVIKLDRANVWIKYGPISLYIRVGFRYIEQQKVKSIDLATFGIRNEKLQGKGYFSMLLKATERLGKIYKYDGIFVESIINPTLVTILANKGFRKVSNFEPPNMYKEII